MIRLDNISKHYHKSGTTVRALDGVSLEIPKGQLALVRGHSGSGKTTMVDLIAGLTRPTSGDIFVGDLSLNAQTPPQLSALRARRIAVVFQLFHLVPYLTAMENVLLPTLAARTDNAVNRAEQLLGELGLSKRAKHYPAELSAGERQRCALARALLHSPDIILADEPTGNLDEESAAKVLDQLDRCRAQGATILLVSHQHLHRIEADLELELRDGVLVK